MRVGCRLWSLALALLAAGADAVTPPLVGYVGGNVVCVHTRAVYVLCIACCS